MNELVRNMRQLVDEKQVVSGIAVAYGNAQHAQTEFYGNAREVRWEGGAFLPDVRKLEPDAIFDLASVSKLFTALAVMQLSERGVLQLSDPLDRLDKRFVYIGGATVEQLLSFRAGLKTAGRIDEQANRDAALEQLFSIEPTPLPSGRYYTDMTSMVLKYVVEAASGMPFYEYLQENILLPLGMRSTFSKVPEALYPKLVDYNYERRIMNGQYLVDMGCTPGQVHDYKARVLRQDGDDLCGHAGLFSTMEDMVRLAMGLIHNRLISKETLLEIGKNRTGYPIPGGYTQYLGYLCYAKHPIQTYSEVPACFGDQTIALNGFTGNHFSVDPEQNRFMIILANRIHNRVTLATGRPDPNDTTLSVEWNDGKQYPVSQNFTYLKDACLKEPMGRLLEQL